MLATKAKKVEKRLANYVVWLVEFHWYCDNDRAFGVQGVIVGDRTEVNAIDTNARECDRVKWRWTVARALRRIVKKQSNRTETRIKILVRELLHGEFMHAPQVVN